MKDFLARHEYIVVWVLFLVIIGSLAYVILQLNSYVPTVGTPPLPPSQSAANGGPAAQPPALPPTPSVSFFIQKAPKNATSGNSFIIQWQNLPNGTVALNILRATTGQNNWSLWKTVTLTHDELGSGTANINIGTSTEGGYSFEIQAVGDNGETTNVGNSTSTSGETVLWTSSSTIPVVTTSTPPEPPMPPPPPQNPPANNPTSSTPQNPENPTSTSSSTNPSNNGNNNNGIPYYNPQVQITAYGTAPGSFWVSHVNQSIEIGWQNIPAGIDTITVARSASSTGPWNTIIIQHNPGTSGSYSLQLVDDTIDQPYYYEMTALEGTTTIATYGPAYLDTNN